MMETIDCGNGLSFWLVHDNERFAARLQVSSALKRQEGTMQLRHIRPGSLEWQDAKVDESEAEFERLTPEEIIHLRKLSEDRRRSLSKDAKSTQTEAQ
jgi:hypothetical protein